MSTRHGINGHTHIPTAFLELDGRISRIGPDGGARSATVVLERGRVLLNPGSVGQPRDGNPEAAYAIVDLATPAVRFGRVPYDVATTQAKIRSAGLPEVEAARLALGR